jgi:hypothetical protein
MNITNRLFAYPVLSEEKNDYKQSIFKVNYAQKYGVNDLQLSFDIEMNCRELQDLILNGQAEYVVHLECTTTAYREVLHSVSSRIDHKISFGRVNGTLEAVAFVILKKPITSFLCRDWVEDFDGMTFDLSQGSILAYQNLESLDITKAYEEFANAESIFSVYKRMTDEDKPAEINLESSKIKIGLGKQEFDVFSTYSTYPELQSLLHAILILPALVYVFEELKQEEGEEIYKGKEWFMALEKAYEKRGINFMDEVLSDEKNSYQLAQEVMEFPISKAIKQIPMLFDDKEED